MSEPELKKCWQCGKEASHECNGRFACDWCCIKEARLLEYAADAPKLSDFKDHANTRIYSPEEK